MSANENMDMEIWGGEEGANIKSKHSKSFVTLDFLFSVILLFSYF